MDRFEQEALIKWVLRLCMCFIAIYIFPEFLNNTLYFMNHPGELLALGNQQTYDKIVSYGIQIFFEVLAVIAVITSIKDIIYRAWLHHKISKDIDKRFNLKAWKETAK